MISPGVTLGGRYRLDERIAGGGMGDVWRGTDEVLGRTVAVKILLPALLDEPGFAERFRGEARTMATINHPGVVDVYDYGSDQSLAFLVMEYVEGDALSRTLSRVGRLTPARTMALVAQAADALQAAHANGIVHRDVKPGNLLVRPNGTLVLTDFGIARSALVGQLTVAGSVLGTASYISPEQASGAVATAASDVYALGVVAYQCLSGHRPFDGATPIEIAMRHVRDTPRPLPSDIPPSVRAIVDRALAKDPAARWPSAAAMGTVARQAAASLTSTVSHPVAPQSAHPISPGAGRSAAPGFAPASGPPATGNARPPYPPMPRPVSGARGAASVPSGPPAPSQPSGYQPAGHQQSGHQPSGYQQSGYPAPGQQASGPRPQAFQPSGYQSAGYRPSAPQPGQQYRPPNSQRPAGNSAGRSWLIALAVVLALLVLLCTGVISFFLNKNNDKSGGGGWFGEMSAYPAVVDTGVAGGRPPTASYRLINQAGVTPGWIRANEGRQTL